MTEKARPKNRYGNIEPIPDTMENIAAAIMQGPPKKDWRFEAERDRAKDQASIEESRAAN